MKKFIQVTMLAAGIAFVSGCMSAEEIKAAKEKAEARKIAEAQKRKEEKAKAKAAKFAKAKEKADAGDGRMAYQTGIMLAKGDGVKQDLKLAFVYYEKAVQAGNISAAWRIINGICKTSNTEHSKLFGDCYELLWKNVWSREVWPNQKNMAWNYKQSQHYKQGIAICQKYFTVLQKNRKAVETYALAERLTSIVKTKPSDTFPSAVWRHEVRNDLNKFLDTLAKIKTEAGKELEQKRIAEQKLKAKSKLEKLEEIKYLSKDLAHGMKLFKHLTSGISLEWFMLETLSKDGQIRCHGVGNYFLILSSTAYPNVRFKFSSNKKVPEIPENINWSNYNQKNLSDQQGVLFEVEISLPGNIDSKKIYQKYCNEYPQIKPIFKPNNYEKPIPVPPQAYGYRMKIKSKRGQYLWKNDKAYISFSFADKPEIMVSGPDPDNVEILKRTFERQQQEMGMGIRKVLVRDEKLYERFIGSKIKNDKNAAKAKEEAAQNSALDF